jgi:DNA-binding NtrC family response regulator
MSWTMNSLSRPEPPVAGERPGGPPSVPAGPAPAAAPSASGGPSGAEGLATTGSEILVLNRDPELRAFLNRALFSGSFSFTSVENPGEARSCLRWGSICLLLVGIEEAIPAEIDAFLNEVRSEWPQVALVAIAPRPAGELVREVMLRGVRDFLLDPLDAPAVVRRLKEILQAREPRSAVVGVPAERAGQEPAPSPAAQPPSAPHAREGSRERRAAAELPVMISTNPRMRRMLEIVDTVAPTDSTVLIQGESGTGKEIVAKRIHQKSGRADEAFVEVNCGALPENLLESQLFGHEKGSFTGAVQRQVGLFEIAHQGTIFLDEIGEMGLDMQVKLLRVLQSQEFRRIGGSQTLKVDVRVIAATNRDLKEEVEKHRFRADLFYRLNVILLEIPPLRDRLEEVPELVSIFCERFHREKGLPRKSFQPEAVARMQKCRWLGNVRELENAVERLILLAQGTEVAASDVEEHLADGAPLDSPFAPTLSLDEVKRIHIATVLKANQGNKMRTARLLGINVKTLYNLIKSLNIPVA